MTPKTKDQYMEEISNILDQASEDDSLSAEDYEALCQDVVDICNERIEPTTEDEGEIDVESEG